MESHRELKMTGRLLRDAYSFDRRWLRIKSTNALARVDENANNSRQAKSLAVFHVRGLYDERAAGTYRHTHNRISSTRTVFFQLNQSVRRTLN